jgi:hypothetical protein
MVIIDIYHLYHHHNNIIIIYLLIDEYNLYNII